MSDPAISPGASISPAPAAAPAAPAPPALHVAPSPHVSAVAVTTKGMMLDTLIGLAPILIMSLFFFRWYAMAQVGVCVICCLGFEALFARMRGRAFSLGDLSVAVTGMILALSMPWSAPWYAGVVGALVAVGLGKWVFGGLGYNIFNPAMVGRAFVMLSFARELGAAAYVKTDAALQIVTQATPLTIAKTQADYLPDLWPLFLGSHNGSLGETSAIACLIGGIYLCARRSAAWEIPAAVLGSVAFFAGLANLAGLTSLTALHHLLTGSLMLGAFFIATDPVTSPLTFKGKVIFGAGIGFFVMIVRLFSGYPDGVMFAVLLMNAATPLINRWTIPRPLGALAAVKKA